MIKILGVFGIQDDSLKCTAETVKKKPVKQKAEKTVHTQKEEIKPNTQKVQEAVFASLEEADLSRQISEQLERERNLHENEIRKACRNSKKKCMEIVKVIRNLHLTTMMTITVCIDK